MSDPTPLDALLNNLSAPPPSNSGDVSAAPSTAGDALLRNLNAPPGQQIITNPGAGTQDVASEMKALGYEGARGASANLVEKIPESLMGDVRQQARQFEAEHPYASVGAQLAGSAIPGALVPQALPLRGLQPGATMLQSGLANAALGAGFGAMSGYGESQDYPLRDTAYGAAVGAGLGGAGATASQWILRPAFEGLAASVSGDAADRLAMGRIRQRVLQSQQFGGPSFADMQTALAAQPDKPLGLVDVNEGLQGLAGSVARTPGGASQAARTFFNGRDVTAMSRTLDDIDNHVSSGQDVFTSLRAIDAKKAVESKPLYDLYRGYRPISPDEMQPGGELYDLMQTPAMKQATRNALTIAANRRVDPNTLGITFNEAGDPIFAGVPSWQTLQYVKQGLDDVVGANRNAFGKIIWDNQTRAVNDVLQDYQKFLSSNNPFWKPANDVWGGHQATQNAMEWGQDFKQFTPAQIQYRLAQMGPSEREAALVGLADTMRKDVMTTRPSADEGKRLLPQGDQPQGWQYQQIAPFFQDENTFKRWAGRVLTESQMANTKSNVMANSKTAERLREDAEHGTGAGAHIAQLGAGVAGLHVEPFASIPMLARGATGLLSALREPNKRVAESMAPILFNPDYAQNVANLKTLGISPSGPWLPRFMPGIAETAGAIPGGILGRQAP